MRSILLIARVSVVVLLFFLIVSALAHAQKSFFFGLASVALIAAAVDAFTVYFCPSLSIVDPANKTLAYLVSISPLSNWNRKPSSLLVGGILFAVLAIAAFTRALGYW